MTEAIIVIAAFVGGLLVAVAAVPRAGRASMGLAPLRSGFSLPRLPREALLPYYPIPVPDGATHVNFMMVGMGQAGSVYSLICQPIEKASVEAHAAKIAIDPVIQRSLELESDLIERGCSPITDIRFCVSKVDDEGTEKWWSGSRWVGRWDKRAAVFDIWGTRY
jgi:hypothetical protein